jgi:hypothetical protein
MRHGRPRLTPALFVAFIAITALTIARGAHAADDADDGAASWYRETLLGENSECFVRLVSIWDSRWYGHALADTQRVERVRKSDFRVVESIPIVIAHFTDEDSGKWRSTFETLPAFDLAGYLKRHRVAAAFSAPRDDVVLDSKGLRAVYQDGAAMTSEDQQRRGPRLRGDFTLAGLEATGCIDCGHWGWLYARVSSIGAEYVFPIKMSDFRKN